MTDFQTIADRVEIEALRAEYTDAAMLRDHDRFAALFTKDALMRIPGVAEFTSQAEVRAGIERLQAYWDFFIQNTHPGTIQLSGDTAVGRTHIAEFGRLHDGTSHLNYSIYHDRYQRTPAGWKFAERVYELKYVDTTPLPGSPHTPTENQAASQLA